MLLAPVCQTAAVFCCSIMYVIRNKSALAEILEADTFQYYITFHYNL